MIRQPLVFINGRMQELPVTELIATSLLTINLAVRLIQTQRITAQIVQRGNL